MGFQIVDDQVGVESVDGACGKMSFEDVDGMSLTDARRSVEGQEFTIRMPFSIGVDERFQDVDDALSGDGLTIELAVDGVANVDQVYRG